MEQSVALKISNSEMRFETMGTMNRSNDCVTFAFEMDEAQFYMSAFDKRLSIMRCGKENYEFDIVEGCKTKLTASTDFGSIPVDVNGLRVSVKQGKTVELLVKYLLTVADECREMLLHVRAIPQGGVQ